MQQPPDSITVGDLMQRVAADASRKVLAMLEAMPAQTPELRFEKMKACIARLKKQLCQLLALLMWLRDDNVQKYLNSMYAMSADIRQRQMQLDGVQDAFFFLHQSIYRRRRQALDVSFAADILARGTYAHLPASIFDFGAASTKSDGTSPEPMDTGEMDMFIGCKLCLSDPIADRVDTVCVQDGKLVLKKASSFEIYLTLAARTELAHWVVADLRFTVEHRGTEGFIDSYGHAELQESVKAALNARLRHKSDDPAVNSAADRSVLCTVCSLCQHVAQSVCLKLLYIQATYHSRHLSEGYSMASYTENSDAFVLEYSFWAHSKGRSGAYPYAMRLSLPREATSDTLQLGVFRVLEPLTQGAPATFVEMAVPPHTSAGIAAALTARGAAFSDALSAVLALCAEERLQLVFHLLSRSPLFQKMSAQFAVVLDSAGHYMTVKDGGRNFVRVCVCALTGKFIVAATGISWGMLAGAQDCLGQFLAELNGIVMDTNIKRVTSLEEAKARLGGFTFQTVSKVMRYFLLFDDHSDFELLFGTAAGVPVRWMERLSRAANLEHLVFSMYSVVRSREAYTSAVTKKASHYDIGVVFAIGIDENMKRSCYSMSFCVGATKESVPVFGEVHSYPDTVGSGNASGIMSQMPLLSLLRKQDLIAPVSVCEYISAICRGRVALAVSASSEGVEAVLQRQRLDFKHVSAFPCIGECLSEGAEQPATSRLLRFLGAAPVSASAISAWALSPCDGSIWCAINKVSAASFVFIDLEMFSTSNLLSFLPNELLAALSVFSDRHISSPAAESSSERGFIGCPLDLCPPAPSGATTIGAELISGRYLVLNASASFGQAYLALRSCSDDSGTARALKMISEAKVELPVYGGLGSVAVNVHPLVAEIDFRADNSSDAFCTARLCLRALCCRQSVLSEGKSDTNPLATVCHTCEGRPSLSQSRKSFLGFCLQLLSYALDDRAGLSRGFLHNDALLALLRQVALDVFPAALLASCVDLQLEGIRPEDLATSGSGSFQGLQLGFCNILSPTSFSIVVMSTPGMEILSFCNVDVTPASSACSYTVVQRIQPSGKMDHSASTQILDSSDSVACAKHILAPLMK